VLFILNGIIFILIGLQLPEIIRSMGDYAFWAWKYAVVISAAVIIGRIIWVYPSTYIPRMLFKKIRAQEEKPDVRLVTVIAWSGMRGVVSLAAALALPLTISNGVAFPHRNLIIFLTFCVIFSTLVLQGLTLRPMIKVFGLKADGKDYEDEQRARLAIAASVIEHIEENYALELSDEVLSQVKSKYEIRIERLRKDEPQRRMSEDQIREFHRIQQELLEKERRDIIRLRRDGKISDEVLRKMEYELDLEETRFILDRDLA
jgi:monovalent cation/hydrogen antiporter